MEGGFEVRLSHLAPFQKLDRGEDIHKDGDDADRPFGFRAEREPRQDQQQDTQEYPARVADHSEKSKFPADHGAIGIEGDQRRVPEHNDGKNVHHRRGGAKKFRKWSGGKHEEEPAGG